MPFLARDHARMASDASVLIDYEAVAQEFPLIGTLMLSVKAIWSESLRNARIGTGRDSGELKASSKRGTTVFRAGLSRHGEPSASLVHEPLAQGSGSLRTQVVGLGDDLKGTHDALVPGQVPGEDREERAMLAAQSIRHRPRKMSSI